MTNIQRQINNCLAKYVSGLAANEPVPDWVYELGGIKPPSPKGVKIPPSPKGVNRDRVIERDVGFAAVVPIDMEVPEYIRNIRQKFS